MYTNTCIFIHMSVCMYLHIVLLDRHVCSCVHCSQNVEALSRLHMEAMCTNMNTHINVGKEMGVGIHADLNVRM